jgi:transcription initiation factor TFIIH subunit 2
MIEFKLLEKFVHSYFDQNPISQLGLIVTKNKIAEKVCDLVGNPKKITEKLASIKTKPCHGEPSIQNALELCMSTLRYCNCFILT